MRTILLSAAVLSCFALNIIFSTQTHAQTQAPGTRVVVIDLTKVFDQHPRFKQQMEAMKQEVQAFDTTLRSRADQMQSLQNQMKQFQPGSVEYKQLEEQIMQIQADGQIKATQKKKEFLDREAAIYYSIYQEVVAEVESFAIENGIGIVIRFNSDEIQQDRNSILEGVNRAVVYQSKSNITNAIIERIVRKDPAMANASRQATQPAVR